MNRVRWIIGLVLLCGLAAERASALTYVMSEESRQKLQAEYRALTAQRQQLQNNINNLCGVLAGGNRMFAFSLYGSNRWEYWTTSQVAARLQQLSGNQPAAYQAWWSRLLQQHYDYSRYVRDQLVPQLQVNLRNVQERLNYVTDLLATSESDTNKGLTNVVVNQSPVHIRLWDHGTEDGDIVQLFVNGQLVRQISLTKGGTTVTLPLSFGRHCLEVLAMNEGSESPNTASISITGVVQGKPQQSWELRTGQRTSMWITVGGN